MGRISIDLPPSTSRLSASEYLRLCRTAPGPSGPPRKRNAKYGNRRTDDGFDSVHERSVYYELELARHTKDPAHQVLQIDRQVRFELIPKQGDERAVHYVADFVVTYADGRRGVIDAKSSITRKNRAYVLKRKLMLQVYGLAIEER